MYRYAGSAGNAKMKSNEYDDTTKLNTSQPLSSVCESDARQLSQGGELPEDV